MKFVEFLLFTFFSAIQAVPRTLPPLDFGSRDAIIDGEFKLWGSDPKWKQYLEDDVANAITG
jgi:hypothetical protein